MSKGELVQFLASELVAKMAADLDRAILGYAPPPPDWRARLDAAFGPTDPTLPEWRRP
jgi:hypothetical protein